MAFLIQFSHSLSPNLNLNLRGLQPAKRRYGKPWEQQARGTLAGWNS